MTEETQALDYKTATIEQLREEQEAIERTMAEVKMDLSAASQRKMREGRWANPAWWTQKQEELKTCQLAHQQVNRALGDARRRRGQHKEQQYAERTDDKRKLFVEICQRRLTDETFKSIWEDVEAEIEARKVRAQETA